jgi:hypothetical protein
MFHRWNQVPLDTRKLRLRVGTNLAFKKTPPDAFGLRFLAFNAERLDDCQAKQPLAPSPSRPLSVLPKGLAVKAALRAAPNHRQSPSKSEFVKYHLSISSCVNRR